MSTAATISTAVPLGGSGTAPAARFQDSFAFELRKLLAPRRTQAMLLVCALLPISFVAAVGLQDQLPADIIFGRWVTQSGWSAAFMMMSFCCLWILPLLTSVVAGDSFAQEDRLGTWRHLVMAVRSPSRIFAAKTLAAYLVIELMVLVYDLSAVLGGLLFVGNHPAVGLSGQLVGGGDALRAAVLVWLSMSIGALGFAAVGVLGSILMGRSPMGLLLPAFLSLFMQLCQLLPIPVPVRMALPSQTFVAWRGLLADPVQTGPWWVGLGVSLVWLVAVTALARHFFLRRDFTDLAYDGAPRRTMLAGLLPLLLLVVAVSAVLWPGTNAAGQGVTRAKVEKTMAESFTNLHILQSRQMGRAQFSAQELAATAACDRGGDLVEDQGPGNDWRCVISYRNPGSTGQGQAIYQMDVLPDGRVVADGDGPIPVNGYFLVPTATGPAANPLWQFDALVDLLGQE